MSTHFMFEEFRNRTTEWLLDFFGCVNFNAPNSHESVCVGPY